MDNKYKRVTGWRKWAITCTMGTAFAFPLGTCRDATFESTATTTLNASEVVTFLVRSWFITPIDNFITERVQNFFEDEDDE